MATKRPAAAKETRGKRQGEDTERLTVYVPPAVAEAVRVHCAMKRRTLSDAVSEALAVWLKSQGA